MASSFSLRTIERGFCGPVLQPSTVSSLRHFVTALGSIPNPRFSSETEACDRCIAVLTDCVVVALS